VSAFFYDGNDQLRKGLDRDDEISTVCVFIINHPINKSEPRMIYLLDLYSTYHVIGVSFANVIFN